MEKKILYAFDFDYTILECANHYDLLTKNGEIDTNYEGYAYLTEKLNEIGASIDNVYVQKSNYSFFSESNIMVHTEEPVKHPNFIRRADCLYLFVIQEDFYKNIGSTYGKLNPEIIKIYKAVEEKCIITRRPIGTEAMLKDQMPKMGLEYPKYGVYCFDAQNDSPVMFKPQVMIELKEKYNFDEVYFYDDDSDWFRTIKSLKLDFIKCFYVDNGVPELI